MDQNHPLQRYQIKRKISVGGMASVFLAEDRLLDREVALKMMHPHLVHRVDAIQRFSFEAKAIAALSHDNIIRIFDYGENHNRPFLVMEFVDGMNLQELLDSSGALPNLITIGIARQIICGLICAHQKGIIHRDIKPANILLNKKGIIRITDFGIASLSNAKSVTRSGSFIGSPYFISPEQATNKAVTGACDIFSLGVLLYFCLSGELPFTGNTPHSIINAIISNKYENIRKKNSTILLWLADLVDRCLKKNPSERPGAPDILKTIDRQCKGASLSLDCSRIIEFQKSSEQYRASEIKTLFNQYQLSASKNLRCCRIPSAIRKKKQARLLKDTQHIHQKSKTRRLPFIVGGITMLLSSSAIVFFITKLKFNKLPSEKPAVSIPAEHTRNTSSQVLSPNSTKDTIKNKPDTFFLPHY